jgi:hypothetical protein
MAEVEQELVARIGERAVEQLRTLLDLDWPAAD